MSATLVVGTQWGDEGKAKVVDYLSEKADIIVRYQGGANAGHTVIVDGKKYIFHLVPSGIMYPDKKCVIGNGVVLDMEAFLQECDKLEQTGISVYNQVLVSESCHILFPFHKLIDQSLEDSTELKIGTTKKGIGICYSDKILRKGFRVGDLFVGNLKDRLKEIFDIKNEELSKFYGINEKLDFEHFYQVAVQFSNKMKENIINCSYFLNNAMQKGGKVLLEGAQGCGLDIDFGTYPYVTSSNPSTGGAITGTGISYHYLKNVIGITKAYSTRVGEGPYPTELLGLDAEKLRKIGHEFGATTGRPRRCGWFDVELIKHSARVNGLNSLALTKLDVLSEYDKIPVAIGYEKNGKKLDYFPSYDLDNVKPIYQEFDGWKEDIFGIQKVESLPDKCRSYVQKLSELTNLKISLISTGPDRNDTIINGI